MTTHNSPRTFDCAIIGGGIHGTYLLQRLLEDGPFERSRICVIDPHERLLTSFRAKTRVCGMDSLRSTFVHHVGTEPFGLENFAEANDRENELVPTVDYPPRPSLDLFLDYSEYVVDRNDLQSLHHQASVTAIHELPETQGLKLETTTGPIEADHCILAIGQGDRYRWPDWATDLDHVEHVWGEFNHERSVDRTIVVGGGITATQLACELSETQSVALLSRHPLEWELSEADPRWINWSYIKENLHTHPPGSSNRFDVLSDARYTATVPPYLYATFEQRTNNGALSIVQGDVESAVADDASVRLFLDHGLQLVGNRVVLATGFEPVFEHPFVERIAEDLELARGHRGMPILDDDTLAWQSNDGHFVPLYVTGALAQGTVGPFATNIPGARRAGDRILTAITQRSYCSPRSVSNDAGERKHKSEATN